MFWLVLGAFYKKRKKGTDYPKVSDLRCFDTQRLCKNLVIVSQICFFLGE